jgi:hypothetical protein
VAGAPQRDKDAIIDVLTRSHPHKNRQ